MAGAPPQTATPTATPDRSALRAELEGTKAEYRALVAAIGDGDWDKATSNAAWSVREMAFHIASGAGFVAGMAENGTKRGSSFNALALLPRPILDRLSVMHVRRSARKATRESLVSAHDAGIDRSLEALDAVQDGDWARTVKTFGGTRTVAEVFRVSIEHLAEHGPEVRAALVR